MGLSDVQMQQLTEVNARFETRRRELFARERALRVEMRRALAGGEAPVPGLPGEAQVHLAARHPLGDPLAHRALGGA